MKLLPHQIEAIQRTVDMGGVQFLNHKTGTGKTFTSLSTWKYYHDQDPKVKLLVICPINLIKGAWIKEIEKVNKEHGWDLIWFNLHDFTCSHVNTGGPVDPHIYIVNYEYTMRDEKFQKVKDLMIKHKLKGCKWFVSLDESSCIKNPDAKTTDRMLGFYENKKFIEGIKQLADYRQELSATPAPNKEWEWWAQMNFLNDNILGDNFFKFRNTHFQLARGKQIAPGAFLNKAQLRELQRTGFKYEIIKEKWEAALNRMKPYVHVVDSLAGMPDEIDEFTIIQMSPEHRKIYNSMKDEYVAEIKREIEGQELSSFAVANMVLTKLLKLRQITSGFVIDDQEKAIEIVKTNPKIEALLSRVEQYGGDQAIIWGQFHWEMDKIGQVLEEEIGGGVSYMHGRVKPNDRQAQCDAFDSGKNRFMVAHPDSMAHGFTFINCHYEDFFSMSYSHEHYIQCRGRTARHGQKHPCVYNHIFCENTIDEDMYRIVTGKATAAEVAERWLKG